MGFSILKEFPGRFLSGDEIVGKEVKLTIREVKKEKAYSPKDRKETDVLVVYFVGKDRGIRLGKERAKELVAVTGSDDTDAWKGKQVVAYATQKTINYQVKNVIHFRDK